MSDGESGNSEDNKVYTAAKEYVYGSRVLSDVAEEDPMDGGDHQAGEEMKEKEMKEEEMKARIIAWMYCP